MSLLLDPAPALACLALFAFVQTSRDGSRMCPLVAGH